jgi:hypothetical protein
LSEHIARLEEKIVILKRQLRAEELPPYQRTERELELANAEEALMLFRKAYGIEQKLEKLNATRSVSTSLRHVAREFSVEFLQSA